MGHLSNPIGFRLTFEKKWNFNFFVKNTYYPEVINALINLRDYIYYYLTRKKILQSGLCLSHFLLWKQFKKYYIKIYIYHIDLEKTAYDLINKFYHLYYETYNEISHKYDKNKTEQQVQLYHYLRDISNSDVFIYLFIYILFYKGHKTKDTNNYLNDNIYMKNKKIQRYYKLIVYNFFKQLLNLYLKKKYQNNNKLKYQNNFILKINDFKKKVNIWIKKLKNINKLNHNWSLKNLAILEKNKKIAKIKGLILYKAKKLIKKKPLTYYMVKKCNYLKKRILTSIQYRIIKLAWQITKLSIMDKIKKVKQYKNNINIIQDNQLLQNVLQKFKFKKNFLVGKYQYYRNLLLKKNKKNIFKFKKILYDKIWNYNFKIVLINNYNIKKLNFDLTKYGIKIDIFSLFFFLSKKTGFKKVKNTLTLWKKWSIILQYIQLFNIYDFLYKEKFFYNLNFFYFYIKIAIWYSTRMKKITKHFHSNFFNLKNLIFSCLQQGVYITFFRKSLIWLNIFLKMGLLIIHNTCSLNKLGFNNIILHYSFISNNNVTAIFLAHYIVLKLKKGFSVVKTLNPLKRELVRVSKKSRNLPYSNYLIKYTQKKVILKYKYKKVISCFMQSCYTLYDYLSSLFYVNNNIQIKPNLFLYFFYFREKIKKIEFYLSSIWRSNILLLVKCIIYYHIKFIFLKIKKKYNKLKLKQIKKIIKKYIKICRLKTKFWILDYCLDENLQIRHGIWLFFLSIFRFYEKKKKKYNYYHKDLKIQILKHYKKHQKFYNLLSVMKQLPKKNIFNEVDANIIYNNNFCSILNLCNSNKLILYKSKKKMNILKITFSSFFNRHYVNYAKLKVLWNIFNKINLRNEKDLYIPKYKSLIMGFKMVLKGRFSRKQRASKVTLIKGKIPLNTFNMKVDYAYESITLKNSAISLKFYLYKASGFEIYKRNLTI